MSLLGVEVGVRRCVVAAWTVEGARIAQAARAYRAEMRTPPALELDVAEVWQAVSDAARQVVAACDADPVAAVAICASGDGIVAMDAQGRPLGPCLVAVTGADSLTAEAEQAVGVQRFFEFTGRLPGRSDALGLLCWLRRERPDVFERAWRIVPLGVMVGAFLGGSTVCDYTQAGYAFPLSLTHRAWSRDLLEACHLPRRALPELMPAGTPIGSPTLRASQEWGLPRGVRLVLGGNDRACQTLGAGVVQPGTAALEVAASVILSPVFQAIPLTSLMLQQGLPIAHHVVPDLFLSTWEIPYGERTLRWYRDNLAPLEKREAQRGGIGVYDLLIGEMPDAPTRMLAVSSLGAGNAPGEEGDAAALLGITPATTRGEIVRGLLEGVGYSLAEGLARCERAGVGVEVLRAVGGGAASDRWLRLIADVTGLPVERSRNAETATLGAALVAGVGAGVYSSPGDAVQAATGISTAFAPDGAHHAAYLERLALLQDLGAPVVRALRRLQRLP